MSKKYIDSIPDDQVLADCLKMLKVKNKPTQIKALDTLRELYERTGHPQAFAGIFMTNYDKNPEIGEYAQKLTKDLIEKDGEKLEEINQKVRSQVMKQESRFLMDPYVINGIFKATKQRARITILIQIYKNVKTGLMRDIESLEDHPSLNDKEREIYKSTIKGYILDYNQRILSLKNHTVSRIASFERTLSILESMQTELKNPESSALQDINEIERSSRLETIEKLIKTIGTLLFGKAGEGNIDKLLSLERLKKKSKVRLDKRIQFLKKRGAAQSDIDTDERVVHFLHELEGIEGMIQQQQDLIDNRIKAHRKQPLHMRATKPL